MGRLLRKFLKKEQGQAYAEYQVLVPAGILLATMAGLLLAPPVADVFRHVTAVFTGPLECVPTYDFDDNEICDQDDLCAKAEYNDEDSGSFTYEDALTVDSVVIKAGKTYEIVRDDPFKFTYTTNDGCYSVTFKTNTISWKRVGNGSDCKSVSHVDYWQAPICAPES
jgi:Flp pilus assembly pilin Flp